VGWHLVFLTLYNPLHFTEEEMLSKCFHGCKSRDKVQNKVGSRIQVYCFGWGKMDLLQSC
jgi:hypothetical protein